MTKKEKIDDFIQVHKWAILSKRQALDIFKEAETEVKIFLVSFFFFICRYCQGFNKADLYF